MASDDADGRAVRESFRRSEQVVDAFVAAGRQRRTLDAQEIRLLARADALIGDEAAASGRVSAREMARRSMIAELATAAHLSEWTVARLLGESADLCDRFGVEVDALERAEISRQHLLVIHEAGISIVDDEARAAYVALALDAARQLTPGRLRAVVRRFAERFLDQTLSERTADAHARRRVEVTDLADGLSQLLAIIPTTLAHGIDDRLTAQSRTIIDATPDETAIAGDDAEPTTDPADPSDQSGTARDTRTLDQVSCGRVHRLAAHRHPRRVSRR